MMWAAGKGRLLLRHAHVHRRLMMVITTGVMTVMVKTRAATCKEGAVLPRRCLRSSVGFLALGKPHTAGSRRVREMSTRSEPGLGMPTSSRQAQHEHVHGDAE